MANSRGNNFCILRLAGAMMVLSGHMCALNASPGLMLFGETIQAIGVKTLFLIGGYLIAKSWMNDPHPLRYSIKRFFRIWPPLAVCVLFCALVLGTVCTRLSAGEYFSSGGIRWYMRNLRFSPVYNLPGVFEDNPYPTAVNGSLWTMPIEVFMYVLVPVCLWEFGKLSKGCKRGQVIGISALLTLAVGIRAYILFPVWGWEDKVIYGTSVTSAMVLIPYYLMGCLMAVTDLRRVLNLPLATGGMLVACCFLTGSAYDELIRMALLPYLVFSVAFAEPVVRLPAWSEISFGIFLYGFPIQQGLVWFLNRHGQQTVICNTSAMVVLSLLAVLPFALLSEFAVERSSIRLGKALCKRMR